MTFMPDWLIMEESASGSMPFIMRCIVSSISGVASLDIMSADNSGVPPAPVSKSAAFLQPIFVQN